MSRLTKEKVVTGALWAGAGKIFSMPAGVISTLILARAVVPADNGAYFVALSVNMIVTGIGALGMDQLVVRFAATHASQGDYAALRQIVGRCLGIVMAFALLLAVIFALLGSWLYATALGIPALAPYVGVLAVWVFFAIVQRQLAETFRGLNDIRMATLSGGVRNGGILNSVIVCIAMLALWACGKLTLFSALLTMLGTSIVIVLFAGIALWRRLRRHTQKHEHAHAPEKKTLGIMSALHEGWPLGLAGLVVVLNNTGTAWLASPLDTANHVALYGVAQRLVQLLIAPMVIVNAVMPPIVAELYATTRLERMEHVVKSIAGLVLLVSLVLVAFLVLGGHPLLRLMFGPYYEAAYPIVLVLCAGHLANIATGSWQIVLPMTGNKHQLLASSAVAVLVQLALGLALGYRFGVLGVAIGYAAGIIASNLVGMVVVHRKLGVWTYASLNLHTARDAVAMVRARLTRRFSLKKS